MEIDITTAIEIARLSDAEAYLIAGGVAAIVLSVIIGIPFIINAVNAVPVEVPLPTKPPAIVKKIDTSVRTTPIQIYDIPDDLILYEDFGDETFDAELARWIDKELNPTEMTFEKGRFNQDDLNALLNEGLAPGHSINITEMKTIKGIGFSEANVNRKKDSYFSLGDNKVVIYYDYNTGSRILKCVKLAILKVIPESTLQITLRRGTEYHQEIAHILREKQHGNRKPYIEFKETVFNLTTGKYMRYDTFDIIPLGEYSVEIEYYCEEENKAGVFYTQKCLLIIEK